MQEQTKRGKGRPKGLKTRTITLSLSSAMLSKLSMLSFVDRANAILKAIERMESIPVGRKKRSLSLNCNTVSYSVPTEFADKFNALEARSFRFEQALTKIIYG